MIYVKTLVRSFHTSGLKLASEKSLLASLRKKTGYPFSNCKKALDLHNNDLGKAEEWLKQQAQSLGWSKATKLEGRKTSQGLIGLAVNNSEGVLVEVNCETDFVARNEEFKKIVEETVNTCLNYIQMHRRPREVITKICLDADQLKNIKAKDGKPLSDHLALMIGTVGENATLKRAICLKVTEGIHLAGYVHPSGSEKNKVFLGRLAGLVAIRPTTNEIVELSDIGKKLCQHIVGMNPQKIGSINDEPVKNKDEETSLVHQEYLLDDTLCIKDILEENNVEVLDFKRFECGENLNSFGNQSLDYVETCQ